MNKNTTISGLLTGFALLIGLTNLATSNDLLAQETTSKSSYSRYGAPYEFGQYSSYGSYRAPSYGASRYNSSYGYDFVGDFERIKRQRAYEHERRIAEFTANFLRKHTSGGQYSPNYGSRSTYAPRYSSSGYADSSSRETNVSRCVCDAGDCPVCRGDGYTNGDYGRWEERTEAHRRPHCNGTGKCPACKGKGLLYY